MLVNGDCVDVLKGYETETFDLIVTDPPYGIAFMGKDWDKALPKQEVWQQCYRTLKEGKMAFIMCSPRQDVLSRMIIALEDAGFRTNYTSIYWTYASGFPKAANISKLIDKQNGRTQETFKPFADYLKQKRLEKKLSMSKIDEMLGTNTAYSWWEGRLSGIQLPTKFYYEKLKTILDLDNRFDELIERAEAEREIIGPSNRHGGGSSLIFPERGNTPITKPTLTEAKKMEGAYVGFQPKPAVEVILTVSKGKSLTWLDDCRIPYSSNSDKPKDTNAPGWSWQDKKNAQEGYRPNEYTTENCDYTANQKGRFPANLLVSDDVLNDGVERISKYAKQKEFNDVGSIFKQPVFSKNVNNFVGDSGSYSRYFDLDKWYSQFIITPKASKSERGIDNKHPTVKPLKLMSYLITMGSREGDLVLDPFVGSGTTYLASINLNRRCIGIEINPEYLEIAKARVKPLLQQTKIV